MNSAASYQDAPQSTVVSYAPIVLPVPGRGEDLQIRVSAPASGQDLPIVIFSHGFGQSLYGYGPLANYWAAHGFAVIQPTHLDSRTLRLAKDDPRRPNLWRFREEDLRSVLDRLAEIETKVPAIKGRLDHGGIAVAGHSWGAQSASMFLGATCPDPQDGSTANFTDGRVSAGVLLTVPGRGGNDLTDFARNHFPFMHPDFSGMSTPTLIVAGDNDHGHMTHRGPDWWADAYRLSPGSKSLFTILGGEHSLGGIAGYEAAETTDENPDRLAAVQKITTAYLRSALFAGDQSWPEAIAALNGKSPPQGKIESK